MGKTFSTGLVLLAFVVAGSALAKGDVAKGKKVFLRCQACHSVKGQNGVGPHLNGILGRTAGTTQGFAYSAAMKDAGAAGLVWSDATLAAFLQNPKNFVKGTKMTFVGLRRDKDIANLTAYLQSTKQ